MEEIAEGIHKVKGYTHDEINPKTGTTGVLGTGGDKVFSNSIYFNDGKSIADVATTIAKKINKEEKKNDALENKEEEKEVRINPNDIDNFLFIISNVMHFTTVESYERYRTIFESPNR